VEYSWTDGRFSRSEKEIKRKFVETGCIKELRLYLQTDTFNQIIGLIMTTAKIFKKEKNMKDAVAL
jgi:hypothetical protein